MPTTDPNVVDPNQPVITPVPTVAPTPPMQSSALPAGMTPQVPMTPVAPTAPIIKPLPELSKGQTVTGILGKMTSARSPLMQQAEAQGRQQAAGRGLLSSTMAQQAGKAAVLQTAAPIATAEAQQYSTQQGLAAQQAGQQAELQFKTESQAYVTAADAAKQINQINAANAQLQYTIAADKEKLQYATGAEAARLNAQIAANSQLADKNTAAVKELEGIKFQNESFLQSRQITSTEKVAGMSIAAQAANLDKSIAADMAKLQYATGAARDNLLTEIAAKREEWKAVLAGESTRLQTSIDADMAKLQYATGAARDNLLTEISAKREEWQAVLAGESTRLQTSIDADMAKLQYATGAARDNLITQINANKDALATTIAADALRLQTTIDADKANLATKIGAEKTALETKIAADEKMLGSSIVFQKDLQTQKETHETALVTLQESLRKQGIADERSTQIQGNYTATITNTNAAFNSEILRVQSLPDSVMDASAKQKAIDEIYTMRNSSVETINELYRASPNWDTAWEVVGGTPAGATGATATKEDLTAFAGSKAPQVTADPKLAAEAAVMAAQYGGKIPSYTAAQPGKVPVETISIVGSSFDMPTSKVRADALASFESLKGKSSVGSAYEVTTTLQNIKAISDSYEQAVKVLMQQGAPKGAPWSSAVVNYFKALSNAANEVKAWESRGNLLSDIYAGKT